MITFELAMETEMPEEAIKLLQEDENGYIIKMGVIYRVYKQKRCERSLLGKILHRRQI